MALNPQILANGLIEVGFKNTEPEVVTGWTNAWFKYFQMANAGMPINVPAIQATPLAAFRASIAGISAPGAGPLAIQNGVIQFWMALTAVPALYFSSAVSITPPPTLSSISAAILSISPVNTSGNVPIPAARLSLAVAIHGRNLGGTATFPGPIVVPIN